MSIVEEVRVNYITDKLIETLQDPQVVELLHDPAVKYDSFEIFLSVQLSRFTRIRIRKGIRKTAAGFLIFSLERSRAFIPINNKFEFIVGTTTDTHVVPIRSTVTPIKNMEIDIDEIFDDNHKIREEAMKQFVKNFINDINDADLCINMGIISHIAYPLPANTIVTEINSIHKNTPIPVGMFNFYHLLPFKDEYLDGLLHATSTIPVDKLNKYFDRNPPPPDCIISVNPLDNYYMVSVYESNELVKLVPTQDINRFQKRWTFTTFVDKE